MYLIHKKNILNFIPGSLEEAAVFNPGFTMIQAGLNWSSMCNHNSWTDDNILSFWSQKAACLTNWFWNIKWFTPYCIISKRLHPPTRIHPLLTILCAGPQQVDDVLVFANNLHHFHLGDEVWQVLLCGVGYKSNIDEHTYILVWQVTKPSASKLWDCADGWFCLCFPLSFIYGVDLKSP